MVASAQRGVSAAALPASRALPWPNGWRKTIRSRIDARRQHVVGGSELHVLAAGVEESHVLGVAIGIAQGAELSRVSGLGSRGHNAKNLGQCKTGFNEPLS